MPFIDLTPADNTVAEENKPTPEAKPSSEVGAAKPKEQQLTSGQKLILAFKVYLKSKGMYSGNVEDPSADVGLIQALRNIERTISEAVDSPAVIGMIWQGNRINPQTTPEDVEKALKLAESFKLKKKAQATVDAFDVEEYQTNPPSATKQNLTGDEAANQILDPDDTQQIGKFKQEVPKAISMDDRIVELIRLGKS